MTPKPAVPKSDFANVIETYDMAAARNRLSEHLGRLRDQQVDPRNARLRLQMIVAELPKLFGALDPIECNQLAAALLTVACPFMLHTGRVEVAKLCNSLLRGE